MELVQFAGRGRGGVRGRKREIYVADRGEKRSHLQLAQAEVANGGCDVQLDYGTCNPYYCTVLLSGPHLTIP